jgi:hypothetical protein
MMVALQSIFNFNSGIPFVTNHWHFRESNGINKGYWEFSSVIQTIDSAEFHGVCSF